MMRNPIYIGLCLLISQTLFGQVEVISTDSIRLFGTGPEDSTSLIWGVPDDSVGYKTVFWVHGISGSNVSWNAVQSATEYSPPIPIPDYPPRKVFGLSMNYSAHENLSLLAVGREVSQAMRNFRSFPPQDTIPLEKTFAIAHSQGGLVSRSAIYASHYDAPRFPRQIIGLATFGSPHNGAAIINSSRPTGPVQAWIDEGCRALAPAAFNDLLVNSWFLSLIISENEIQNFSNFSCGVLGKMALPLLISGIRKHVGEDYAQGAPILDTLNQYAAQDSLPVVCFYAEEEDPVLWRLINSFTQSRLQISDSNKPLMHDPFGINHDQDLVTAIANRINDYQLKAHHHRWLARQAQQFIGLYLLPSHAVLLHLYSRNHLNKANSYSRAYQWLGTANMQWKRFIGARYDSTYIDGYQCSCLIDSGRLGGLYILDTIVSRPSDCSIANARSCTAFARIGHQIIEKPSDGVVPVSSQIAYPGILRYAGMRKINHMQERNSEETKRSLNALFKGTYGKEFKLDEK